MEEEPPTSLIKNKFVKFNIILIRASRCKRTVGLRIFNRDFDKQINSNFYFYEFYISMDISFKSYNISTYQPNKFISNNHQYNPHSPHKHEVPQLGLSYFHPSFCGMKKNNFEGVDYYVADKFKAPIEKFKNSESLQSWAEGKCNEIMEKDYGGRREETQIQRKSMLKEWKDYFENENKEYSPSERLIIWDGITKNLKPNDDTIPPVLNKGVLADTIYNLKKDLKTDKKTSFNFVKTYENNLRAYYTEDILTGETDTKWVVIKSKEHDPDNFKQNVEKLQMLSHKSWCTKSNAARPYLSNGDFHVYLENGQPKIGIRFVEDKIAEIQGERNNSKVPLDYFGMIKGYIKDNKFSLGKHAKDEMSIAEEKTEKIKKAKKYLAPILKKNDNFILLNELGFNPKYDKNGNITLDEYVASEKFDNLTMPELGLDEADLLKNVVKIYGDADFTDTNINQFTDLKEIGGNLYIEKCNITSLGSIEKIGGCLDLTNTNIISLGSLTDVGEIMGRNVMLKSLGNLKYINGSLFLFNSEIEDLGALEKVDGEVSLPLSRKLKSLGNIKYVKDDLDLRGSSIEDLGELETVGGDVNLNDTLNLKTLGKLKHIKKNLCLSFSSIEDLGELETVGKSLTLWGSNKIKSLGKLKKVGEEVNLGTSSVQDLGMLESAKLLDILDTDIDSLGNMKSLKYIKMKNKKQLKDLGYLKDKSILRYNDMYILCG